MIGLSAAPKDKLSPRLAVEAAAGNSSALISTPFIEDPTALPLLENIKYKRQHKPVLTEVERLRIENSELKRALVAPNVVQHLLPEQIGSVPSRKRNGQIDQSKKEVLCSGVAKEGAAVYSHVPNVYCNKLLN